MDIWQVIQFSAAASVVAAVILGLKLLFHDKLDARWHYLIWLVLLVRMLVPVQLEKIRTPISLFGSIPVLRWLGMCERAVHRAGFDGMAHALFLGYLAGTAAFLLYDLTGYLLLRLRIASAKEGVPGDSGRSSIFRASEGVCRRVEETAQKYGLKACSQICVQDTPTPYVCGLWRATLVLTREMACRLEAQDRAAGAFDPDEAVIVHELLHRKYKDVPVNFLIRLVRALNWFNPFLWYVTGVVQNDGEALCDQRVLEYLEQKREGENGYEREYGLLLIRMAEGREKNPAKAGTSNMANSFRNMKTRIRRIADFKKVPPGIGPVTLCITVILSASGIGYCREESWLDAGEFRSERELEYALLKAELYEAQTPVEALHLYLAAIRYRNPVYRMAVMPEEQRAGYTDWVKDNFRWEEGPDFGDRTGDWKEKGYFPAQSGRQYAFTGFTVYNLQAETEEQSCAEVLAYTSGEEKPDVLWEIGLVRENGWKVWEKGETQADAERFEEPALLQASGQGENFRVEVDCWNAGSFQSLNTGEGFTRNVTEPEKLQVSDAFSTEMKMCSHYLSYIGDGNLTDCTVGAVILEEGCSTEEYADCFAAMESGLYSSGGGQENAWENRISGSELMKGQRICIGKGGGGPARWEGTERPSFHVWVYVDGECAEEFTVTVP